MAITVDRGGVTASEWYETGIEAKVAVDEGDLKIRFELDSKGGGRTDVRVNIGPDAFDGLLGLMLASNFERTVRAFSKNLITVNKARSGNRA